MLNYSRLCEIILIMLRVQLEIQFWPLATRVYLISAHCVLIQLSSLYSTEITLGKDFLALKQTTTKTAQ